MGADTRSRGIAATWALCAVLGGCGSSNAPAVIDHTIVEKAIEVSVAQQQHVLSIVSCPKDVRASKSARFTCSVTFANGSQSSIAVSGSDDRGTVSYSGLVGFVNGHRLSGSAKR